MRMVSLREFRTRGQKALEKVPRGEVVLLVGQKGPEYFLVPAEGDIAVADQELWKALARMSLRGEWRLAAERRVEQMTDAEIQAEIARLKPDRPAPARGARSRARRAS